MKSKKILKISLITLLIMIIISLCVLAIYIISAIKPIKNMDVSLKNQNTQYSEIYTNNHDKINYLENMKTNYISINDIPKYTKQAFVSIEDKDFYKHRGLNYKRIIKAGINNIKSGKLKEGASTITQQLVKNRYLTNEKTINRKIQEAYLSKKLESEESKDKILEVYLNTIYFGNGAYGIGEASKIFFNKEVSDLTIAESAMLAGSIKSPSNYSPINNYEKSLKRKNIVLNEMLKDKVISQDQYNKSLGEEIKINDIHKDYSNTGIDLYTQYVLDEASEILNINVNNIIHGNYKIYTYQDSEIQKKLDEKINSDKYYIANEHGNIADSMAMIIDNKSYSVSAISGCSKYNLVNFKRQPGSLIKPIFTYAPAIEKGIINPKTQILDDKINYDGYSPNNVGNKFYGYVSVEDAVAKSLNIPAIKITEKVGLDNCKEYAKKCGIEFNDKSDVGYALSLGGFTDGVTLKSITDAYSALSNNGNYVKSRFIKKIINGNNVTIYNDKMSQNNILTSDTSYIMTDILKYSVMNGTSKKLSNLPYNIAGKTGTVAIPKTNYNSDAYSLAYTTDHTMSVWMGNYSMNQKYNLVGSNNGGTCATEIIRDTFADIYNENTPLDFEKPESVKEIIIDKKTLEEDHIVTLGNNIPERYQIKTYVSKRYMPKIESNKFNKIIPFEFDITLNKNSCVIKFDTHDYIDYKLYRESDNKLKLLTTIKNNNGEYSYIDDDMSNNIMYRYYIVANSNYSDEEFITPKQKIILEKSYDNILLQNNNNTLSWIFT